MRMSRKSVVKLASLAALVPLAAIVGCDPSARSMTDAVGDDNQPRPANWGLAAPSDGRPVSATAMPTAMPAMMTAAAAAMPREAACASVSIDNFSFSPATITVPAGTTVTWVNHDDVPHTVTADDKRFASKALDTDERFAHEFATPGTYPYFCAVHPHMTGKVVVVAK